MFVITECNSRAPQHGICLSSWTNGQCILHRERTVFINKQFPIHYILMCSQLLRKFLEILDIQDTCIHYIFSHNFFPSHIYYLLSFIYTELCLL
jgi:hypothetical protein